ncbi:flagellar hook-length control protein FliK [Paracoccus sp. (in: a-proteobacteria)]|uniref:flagellar hook-length control protein FliK n=1 Tax=Paracoccus sp. TaxID=267 RepID=UPI0027299DA1|nr:flagellar hook-length control protein FliK [Paracoccus sp. (in: a-proteobacteria)]
MADIQIISPMPARADVSVDAATPVPVTGESGFDVWSAGAMVPAAPATAVPTPPKDPLAAWLQQQMGFSGEFSAPPGTDPAIEALAAGLPQLPAPEIDESADIQGGDPLASLLPVDAGTSDASLISDAVSTAPQSTDPTTPAATDAPDAPAVQTAVAPAKTPIVAAGVTQQAANPAPTLPGANAAEVAPIHGGGQPVAPARLGRPIPATESVAAPRPIDGGPINAAPPPIDRAAPDRPAPTVARDPVIAARSEIALPAGLAETLAELPFGTDSHTPAAARPTAAAGSGWQAASHDPRPVLQQVTDALVSTRGDRTEIALSPEELGRIRLVMSGPDRGQITIWAERPETLDLVRRNADLLTQQLADAGVSAGSLDFRRDDRSDSQPAQGRASDDDDIPLSAAPLRVRMSPTALSDRRLDIRL